MYNLSNLEQEIMDIIWKLNSCTVHDVIQIRTQKKQLAYTTIATIIDRLYAKNFLSRVQEGKKYIYTPRFTKEEYGKRTASIFLEKFIKNFGDIAMASFAESIDTLPENKRRTLIETITRHEKNEER